MWATKHNDSDSEEKEQSQTLHELPSNLLAFAYHKYI